MLNASSGNRELRAERFAREAKLAASLRHKNVVDLFDFGETGTGEFFMVMEWVEGESLAQRLSRQPALPLQELFHIVAESLQGLAAVPAPPLSSPPEPPPPSPPSPPSPSPSLLPESPQPTAMANPKLNTPVISIIAGKRRGAYSHGNSANGS